MGLLLTPTPAAAQARQDGVHGPKYEQMVRLYAAGERDAALTQLGARTKARLRADVLELKRAAEELKEDCSDCVARRTFSGFPLRAALLLHSYREISDQFRRPESEQPADCGIGLHADVIGYESRILLILDPTAAAFVRSVFLAVSRHALWSHCVDVARQWAVLGLELSPHNASLHLAHGVALETRAFFTPAPAPETPGLLPRVAAQRKAQSDNHRRLWIEARRAFEAALAVDPGHTEARLRLARILWRLGQPDAAVSHFEAILAQGSDPQGRYLAHLFLGRVLEDKGRLSDSEEQYRAALKLEPLSQTTATALSHVRFLQGDHERAREVMIEGMEGARRRSTHDPWVAYEITQTPDGLQLLGELQKGIRQ